MKVIFFHKQIKLERKIALLLDLKQKNLLKAKDHLNRELALKVL